VGPDPSGIQLYAAKVLEAVDCFVPGHRLYVACLHPRKDCCWLIIVSCGCTCVGSDPPGIKLRAAKALEAVDYFVPGYWVFSKLVQSLADIGYDNNNLVRCRAGLRPSIR
jgi:hypothetical protein